ncbi:MAG TPA: glycosyltransferase [Candidatus Kapabacteria bacterium]|nr:glycosyltransferase [Candidatus Kapabacteria bacterium]
MKKYDIVLVVLGQLNYDARAYNLSNALATMGYSILVISLKSESSPKYLFEHIHIEVHQSQRLLIKWFEFWRKVKQILKNINFDIYIGSDLYSITNVLALPKKKLVIYDSREIYSALASLNTRRISQAIVTLIEKIALRKVDRIVVSGEYDREYLLNTKGLQKPFYIIKNLPPKLHNIDSNYLRDTYNIPAKNKIAIYQGAILKNRGIYSFLKALKEIDNLFFVMIGENSLETALLDFIKKNSLQDKCLILPPIDYNELPKITQSADFGVSLFEPVSDSYKYALPNKIFEYVNCGIPYIATNLPAIKEVTDATKAGILVNDVYNISEIQEKINKLINNYQMYKQYAISSSNKFNYDSQYNIIKDLVLYV